ncbi:MAG: stage III sporulation protein SpoIIIAB [Caloramator sp.]|nr:stage III sporulation protein SpoIIIAB [Caloramator sp.]
MLKIIGGLMVILSTSAMGYLYSFGYKERVRQIRELQFCINSLSSEILYSSNPLWVALNNISKNTSSPFKDLFSKMSDYLKEKKLESIGECFNLALNECKHNLYLEKEDLEILNTFVQGLGSSDFEGHKKNFNIVLKKLEGIEKEAEEMREKNEKLYKYLGVLGGLLIVIILV